VGYSPLGRPFSLSVYNSAGEFICNLPKTTGDPNETPIYQSFFWNGRNYNNDLCASGVYILYLTEPYDRKFKRLILLR
jgi:hypothetical protein